jgi:hypothetical protein
MRAAMIATLLAGGVVAGTANYKHLMKVSDGVYPETACTYATLDGEVCVEGDIDTKADLYVADDATIGDDLAVTGDLSTATITAPIVASAFGQIRFCGNGPTTGAETYLSPVADKYVANYEFGGSGCDGEDNTTIATADEVWHTALAFKPVGMVCVGICTGATSANDAIVFQLYDDTAAVATMTCTFTFAGDATPAQCKVATAVPSTVAAGSAIAIGIDDTNDACEGAGDDFECIMTVQF